MSGNISRMKPRDRTSAVSIKIIETQTVHTDATHFKSVVQCLTGKDSVVGGGKGRESSGAGAGHRKGEGGGGGREGKGEFDDILKMKLPSLEELKEFWDEY